MLTTYLLRTLDDRELCYHVCCSLALLPSGGDDFVSCGEDGTVRVWKGWWRSQQSFVDTGFQCC